MEDFKAYAVIEFETNTNYETRAWLESRLNINKNKGGLEMLTQFSGNAKHQDIYLLVSATTQRLLEGAEEINLKKLYYNNTFREFIVDDMNNFTGHEDRESFLSQAERLKVIDYELFNFMINDDQIKLPGAENISIHAFEPLIHQLQKNKIVKNVFPLHDQNELKTLESLWYKSTDSYLKFKFVPTERIRNYFGESVAFYFNFLEFYTIALGPVAIIGFFTWVLPLSAFTRFAICGVFNLLWSTIFMELWKRRSSDLTYSWGVFDQDVFQRPRTQFQGELGIDPVTNQPQFLYSKKKRMLKKYLVSYPTVAFGVFVAFSLMILYYGFQNKIDNLFPNDTYSHKFIRMIPSTVYSLIVIPTNILYSYVAALLTEWENHRTQSAFESNLTTKLFIFYFANSFVSLFYEAFFNRNYNNLSNLLVSLVIVNALVNKLSEVFAPYIKKKIKKKFLSIIEQNSLSKVEKEARTLEPYDGTYPDYVTMFEQFGYIALFSAVFPWISVAALVNNIMEQRSDAFKYCHVYVRPFPRVATGIGPWYIAFELLSFVAVLTNLSLVAMHPDVREYFKDYTDREYLMLFVIAEHLLIVLKIFIMYVIPDEPNRVNSAKLRYKYDSIQALKREVRYHEII